MGGHELKLPERGASTPSRGYRRLREDPLATVQRLAGDIGPRPATSLAEAKAAAYLGGRLRRAGMLVSADTFEARDSGGRDGLVLAGLALLTALLYLWLPLPSLFLALWTVLVAVVMARRGNMLLLGTRRGSQNVVATRAASGNVRWRVVLLAPLDTPPLVGRVGRALLTDRLRVAGRVVACVGLALLAAAGLVLPAALAQIVWLAQFLPVAYLFGIAAFELHLARRDHSAGAVSDAGALATLLAVAETTEAFERVELWIVAVGATSTCAGVTDLLRRYPFDRDATLFIGLEGIGAGSLCFVTGGDAPGRLAADPQLIAVAYDAGAEPPAEAGPREYRGGLSLAGRLRSTGMRSIAVMCLDAAGRVLLRGSANDTADHVEAGLLEHATQLVTGIVRRLDSLPSKGQNPS